MNSIKTDIEKTAIVRGLTRRQVDACILQDLLKVDTQRKEEEAKLYRLQAQKNDLVQALGEFFKQRITPPANMQVELARLKTAINECQKQVDCYTNDVLVIMEKLPNIPADDVPDGVDENENIEVFKWGTLRNFTFTPLQHDDIALNLGYDPEGAVKIAGARFAVLTGLLAKLQRALGQFMLDVHTQQHGYMEVAAPYLVKKEAAFGTGQLPKFEEDLFQTTDGRILIPTAEMSLTNLVADTILDENELPIRMTALTPCFRKEAGAAGRDTRGLIRQHQFEKCELVTICTPEQAAKEHEHMLLAAETILQQLELPYRKVLLCTGDMGFTAQKTYDLEVWLPGQNTYREISSVSNCGQFQGRRMNARFKTPNQKGSTFVTTLNGSGLAVGRTLVAILENYQTEDGNITIPKVLQPYM